MPKFGGFGGGMPNMQSLMRQAQKMQEEAQAKQQELEESEFEGISSNGLVTLTMNGNKELLTLDIKQEIIDPDDKEMLEDLIIVAFNDASKKVDEKKNSLMGGFGGLM